MKIPDLSALLYVARLRYIQSIHESPDLRNADTAVGRFLPLRVRLRARWIDREELSKLRTHPFYYYLVARTRYYDDVMTHAVSVGVKRIINIGCGTDTRAYRFRQLLKSKGCSVLECDQPDAISAKEHITRQWSLSDFVQYLPIDLNDNAWPDFENCLEQRSQDKTLVLLEGVSPYINDSAFRNFLALISNELCAGSYVAYDFKLRGIDDAFARSPRSPNPFRLPEERNEVEAFHRELGYKLEHMELSSELSKRLLPNLTLSAYPLFVQDALIQLSVGDR